MMFLGTRSIQKYCLEINGKTTISSTEVTLLGINIDWKLKFNAHVKNLCKKARQKCGAIIRLRNKLEVDKNLCYTTVLFYHNLDTALIYGCFMAELQESKSTEFKSVL